jgi:guanyl-specific ribonuclease Sa
VPKWIRIVALLLVAWLAAEWWTTRGPDREAPPIATDEPSHAGKPESARSPEQDLPPEAIVTLEAIERGGPFPYDRDGTVFQNREGRLPGQPRGYYREYTVQTPGSRDRGARRIVAGGDPPEVYYYTDDHYRSFRRVELDR